MPLPPLTPPQLTATLEECCRSVAATAKVFFPERFHRPFSPKIHGPIFDLLDDDSKRLVAIAAPRGCGKTSILNLAFAAQRLLFGISKVLVIVSCTQDHAIRQSENLKRKLTSTPLIRKVFGNIKPQEREAPWSKHQWMTSSGSLVVPLGSGQQLRGMLHDDYRPDTIILDDLEDPEAVRNKNLRESLIEWLMADVMGLMDPGDPWRICLIGTVLHHDSLLENLLNNEKWASVRLELCDDAYHSNWPEYASDERIKEMVEEYRVIGKLDTFARERRNQPVASENAVFTQSMFNYFTPESLVGKELETLVIVDPAKTVSERSDFTAIICVSLDYSGQRIYVRDLKVDRLHPKQIYDAAFGMCDTYGAKVLGVEVNSLNEFIIHPLKDEMIRQGRYYNLVELKPRGGPKGKEERISALSPYYRSGLVYHNRSVTAQLEEQLIAHPRSRYDDAADALAYVIEMKELGNRFLLPDNIEDYDAIEAEYEELLEEDRPTRFRSLV